MDFFFQTYVAIKALCCPFYPFAQDSHTLSKKQTNKNKTHTHTPCGCDVQRIDSHRKAEKHLELWSHLLG